MHFPPHPRPRCARAAFRRLVLAAVLVMPLLAVAQDALKPVTVARGLQNPWSLAFLPDGSMLVTERPGRMRVVSPAGTLGPPLQGLPPVDVGGQGGLLDVALDPKFSDNRLVYWSYSEAGDGGNGTAVARGRLEKDRLADVQVIFRQAPKVSSRIHFGSRLVFDRTGRLFVTLGDRGSRKEDAQVLSNHLGKVVRIEPDGRAPDDNPFAGRADARPELWSYGHRNVQGAALHPQTGALWTHEHGPQGGDELNVTEAGRNHGWPVVTYGRNYGSGTVIGEATERADVPAPVTYWVPSVAPSGMAFLTSDRYPAWRGQLFVGAMKERGLVRLQLDGRRVVAQERLLESLGERIRDVRQGLDGWLYVLTDNDTDGRILRLEK